MLKYLIVENLIAFSAIVDMELIGFLVNGNAYGIYFKEGKRKVDVIIFEHPEEMTISVSGIEDEAKSNEISEAILNLLTI